MTDQSTDPIYLRKRDAIAEIIINRPEQRNALQMDMWAAISEFVADVEADQAIKLLVLRGITDRAFSAGADIKEFQRFEKEPELAERNRLYVRNAQRDLLEMKKPSVALIQGPCIGGGCGLAVACDLRFADDTAKFGITPAKLGIAYSLQDTKTLADLVGPAQAKHILFSARILGAEEALRIGLVNAVWPSAEFAAKAHDELAHLTNVSQFTIQAAKSHVRQILDGVTDDTKETIALVKQSFRGEDHREGVNAFVEKRAPRFTWNG